MRAGVIFVLMAAAALSACGKNREEKFREDFDTRAAELEAKAKKLEAEADAMMGKGAKPQVADSQDTDSQNPDSQNPDSQNPESQNTVE